LLAQKLEREMDGGLDEIPEVDEENLRSNRAIRNDLKA
jgi:hypothetical protein